MSSREMQRRTRHRSRLHERYGKRSKNQPRTKKREREFFELLRQMHPEHTLLRRA